ncbi:HEAT repeat domain-containing protein [Yokenella regensburgei]|uniref:HEAT repeat domain-containing protein n=1 Tax=Yokenella regensburgei TaxID=158877 RepID=UPI003F14F4DE
MYDNEAQLHQQILALLDKPWCGYVTTGGDGRFLVDALRELTRHHNGYVREKAVKALALKRDISALGELIVAVNDWVEPIHHAADEAVRALLTVDHIPAFIDKLPAIRQLAGRTRYDHREFVAAVSTFLVTKDLPALQQALCSPQRAVRDAALHTLIEQDRLDDEDALLAVLANRDSNLRALAVDDWLARNRALSAALQIRLLCDPWVRIRRAVLFYLDEHRQLPPETLHQRLLLDKNALIQQRTRHMLEECIDARAFWLEILNSTDAAPTQRRAALYGLKEARYPELLPLAKRAWRQAEPGVRKAALHILIELQGEESKPQLLDALLQPSLSMALAAHHLLTRASFTLTPDDVKQLLNTSPSPAHRAIYLRLLRQLNKWDGLILLLHHSTRLTADEREAECQLWISRFNQAGIPPTSVQRETLAALLPHEPKIDKMISGYLP